MAINLQQISARLNFYMRIKELDVYQLSVLTNTPPAMVGCIVQGEDYCMDDLLGFLKQLPDVNSRWVIYGEGNVFKSEGDTAAQAETGLKKDRAAYLAEMQNLLHQLEEIEKQQQQQTHLDQLRNRIRELTKHI